MKLLRSIAKYYLLLVALFVTLIFLLPASQSALRDFHITALQYHLLLFVVELPLVIIWFVAIYGYGQLKNYALKIRKSREFNAYKELTQGSKWLAMSLIIPSFVSLALLTIANNHPSTSGLSTIATNYLTVAFSLLGFTYVSKGAQYLCKQANLDSRQDAMQVILLVFIILGVVYCFLVFRNLDLRSLTSADNRFYMPIWLMIMTLTIPYLYTWFIGLLAAYDLSRLAAQTKGVLYRQAFRFFAGGYLLVIAGSIAIQYTRSLIPRGGHLSLNTTLMLVYIIYFIIGLGFVLISHGAQRLKKIEEV